MKTLLLKLAKLKRLSSLLLLFVLVDSCKKAINLNHNWEGYVFEKHTGAPVIGATVKIKASKVSSGVFNSSLQPIATVTTNSNGYYSFEYERQTFTEVVAEVSKSNYFSYTEELDVDAITSNKNFSHNITITPRAWITLEINHQGNGVDQFALNYRNLSIYRDCANCCKNDNLNFNGSNVNYELTCTSEANLYHRYRTIVTLNGQQTEHMDSVFVAIGDTTLIDIVY
jgi:hypothetical protein